MGLALMDVGLVRTKSAGDLLLRTSMDFRMLLRAWQIANNNVVFV